MSDSRELVFQYVGRCPQCNARHVALLVNRSSFIPYPSLEAACQCQLPAIALKMVFDGPAEEKVLQSITYVAADTYVHATFIRRIV